MKTLIALLLMASTCFASPFLVCDPSPEAVGLSYEIWNNGTLWHSAANEPDGSIKMELKDIPVGDYEVKARYFRVHEWGTSYSDFSLPFSFTRPGTTLPFNPVNPRLSR